MKHSIRQRVINEHGLSVTKIEHVTGELGSGVFDKNGREIFEGDIVKIGNRVCDVEVTFRFSDGEDVDEVSASDIEIVGHVEG